jgi:hypothetical protein
MITQGPFDLTLDTPLPLIDPGANSNNPATAVQIQNASPFIVEVNTGGIVLTIQSFTAQTIPTSGGGQQMNVDPIASGPSAQTVAAKSLSIVWLLAGESAPMVDGPLTASAIATTLAAQGLAGAQVISETKTVASGANQNLTSGFTPAILWNWGFFPTVLGASTWPTLGGVLLIIASGPNDSIGWDGGASNRLAGIRAETFEFFNYTDKSLDIYVDTSQG